MAPSSSIECGITIGGIENEMPFTIFKVYSDKDSVVADTQEKFSICLRRHFWEI